MQRGVFCPGRLLRLTQAGKGSFLAALADVQEGTLVVTWPKSDAGDFLFNAPVRVEVLTKEALFTFISTISKAEPGYLILRRPQQIKRLQRRAHYRINTVQPVRFRFVPPPEVDPATVAWKQGHIRDLSGGGLRLLSPEPLAADGEIPSQPLVFHLELPELVEIQGEVVQAYPREVGVYPYGVRFLPNQTEQEKIIRYVFTIAREDLRRKKEALAL